MVGLLVGKLMILGLLVGLAVGMSMLQFSQ